MPVVVLENGTEVEAMSLVAEGTRIPTGEI